MWLNHLSLGETFLPCSTIMATAFFADTLSSQPLEQHEGAACNFILVRNCVYVDEQEQQSWAAECVLKASILVINRKP